MSDETSKEKQVLHDFGRLLSGRRFHVQSFEPFVSALDIYHRRANFCWDRFSETDSILRCRVGHKDGVFVQIHKLEIIEGKTLDLTVGTRGFDNLRFIRDALGIYQQKIFRNIVSCP